MPYFIATLYLKRPFMLAKLDEELGLYVAYTMPFFGKTIQEAREAAIETFDWIPEHRGKVLSRMVQMSKERAEKYVRDLAKFD